MSNGRIGEKKELDLDLDLQLCRLILVSYQSNVLDSFNFFPNVFFSLTKIKLFM